MKKITCFLFDMDGVILDTESQYDIFWKHQSDRYNLGIENFEKTIKGTTLPNILSRYFSELTADERHDLVLDLEKFETNMNFVEIPGSLAFVEKAKKAGLKVALVTSSTATKMNAVNSILHFDKVFDTIVYSERVKHGKPDPECFLLATKDLGVDVDHCLVFEDSFAGIQAATAAGIPVVGLATTHSRDEIKNKCKIVIDNFNNLELNDILSKID